MKIKRDEEAHTLTSAFLLILIIILFGLEIEEQEGDEREERELLQKEIVVLTERIAELENKTSENQDNETRGDYR